MQNPVRVMIPHFRCKQLHVLWYSSRLHEYLLLLFSETGSEGHLEKHVMYCRWYLDNLNYLKELKTQFDNRVYLPLTRNMTTTDSDTENVKDYKSGQEKTKPILEYRHSCPDITDLYDYTDLRNIVGRLDYLRDRLSHLLEDEGEIDVDLFSVNSAFDENDNKADQRFLRLVPDILVKLNNAATLAQQWLDIAATKEFDAGTRLTKLERVKTILGDRLANINNEIQSKQKELSVEAGDLKELRKREERSNSISSQHQSLEIKVNRSLEKIDRAVKQISDIEDLITTAAGNKQFTSQLNQELKKKRRELNELNQNLKILEFEREITTEDLCLELEIKPELIRLTTNLQEKCQNLESILEAMRLEKERLELALKPVIDDESKAHTEAEDKQN